MGWNRNKAINYLRSNAESGSLGCCAQYTREAIEAGGVALRRHADAKDYGISLIAVGFQPILLPYPRISFLPGDVVVMDGIPGHPEGHMAMFDGKIWISDFKQRDF